jgi:hypothetical protein
MGQGIMIKKLLTGLVILIAQHTLIAGVDSLKVDLATGQASYSGTLPIILPNGTHVSSAGNVGQIFNVSDWSQIYVGSIHPFDSSGHALYALQSGTSLLATRTNATISSGTLTFTDQAGTTQHFAGGSSISITGGGIVTTSTSGGAVIAIAVSGALGFWQLQTGAAAGTDVAPLDYNSSTNNKKWVKIL